VKVSKRLALGASAIAALGIAVPSFAAPHSPAGGSSSATCNDGTVSWNPTNLWPPNHKFVPIHISYRDSDNDGDKTSIAVTGVTETDGTNAPMDATVAETLNGSGKPGQVDAQPDANYPPTMGADGGDDATWTEDVRAERSGTDGHGSGRTYTISVQCTDTNGTDPTQTSEFGPNTETGSATLSVTVPHDQGVVKP
jgi:hypothetical protein